MIRAQRALNGCGEPTSEGEVGLNVQTKQHWLHCISKVILHLIVAKDSRWLRPMRVWSRPGVAVAG